MKRQNKEKYKLRSKILQIKLREAILSDAEMLYRLNKDELGYNFDLENTRIRLTSILNNLSHKIIVALVDEEIVAYVHGVDYDLFYSYSLKNIMGLAVSSKYKRRGIGRLLMQEIENWAKDTGAVGVRLNSGSTRQEAHEFYLSCGYELKKEQKNFFKEI